MVSLPCFIRVLQHNAKLLCRSKATWEDGSPMAPEGETNEDDDSDLDWGDDDTAACAVTPTASITVDSPLVKALRRLQMDLDEVNSLPGYRAGHALLSGKV